jgi:hypothetical protein
MGHSCAHQEPQPHTKTWSQRAYQEPQPRAVMRAQHLKLWPSAAYQEPQQQAETLPLLDPPKATATGLKADPPPETYAASLRALAETSTGTYSSKPQGSPSRKPRQQV